MLYLRGGLVDVILFPTGLGQLSVSHQHKIIYAPANAIMFLHSAKKVHCQIRADMAHLDRNGKIYFGDFRLVRMVAPEMSCLNRDH
jgi:serine/threonine protein kinase